MRVSELHVLYVHCAVLVRLQTGHERAMHSILKYSILSFGVRPESLDRIYGLRRTLLGRERLPRFQFARP